MAKRRGATNAAAWLLAHFEASGLRGRHMLETRELHDAWEGAPADLDDALRTLRDRRVGPRLVCTDGAWWFLTSTRLKESAA